MKSGPDITLEEAQRRFIRMIRERGIAFGGEWRRDEDNFAVTYSAPIPNLAGVRAVMWREGKKWAASISLQVHERGEWILAGGLIGRQKKQNWRLPSPIRLISEIQEVREVIQRWDMERDRYLNVVAMVKFAHKYTRVPGSRLLIERVMSGIESGVTSEATVSEALSIVQHLYCRTRLDRVRVCEVWREVFR